MSERVYGCLECWSGLVDEVLRWAERNGLADRPAGDEVWAAALRGVVRAQETFRPDRGATLEWWARKNARWAVSKACRERRDLFRSLPDVEFSESSVRTRRLTPRQRARCAETREGEAATDRSWSEAREHLLAGLTERQLMLVEDRIDGRTIEEIARLDGIYPKWIERELEEIRGLVEGRRRRAPAEPRLEDLHERFCVRPRPRPVRRR